MSTINDLREQRAKLMTDAQAILLASPDAEKRASAHKMLADVDTLETDINVLVQVEKKQTEERNRTAPNRDQIETAEVSQKEKDKRSLVNYMRTGRLEQGIASPMAIGGGENRAIDTSTGAALIPQSMSAVLTDALLSYGEILNYITIEKTASGEPFKIASNNDTANLLALIAEDTGVSEVDPTINSATVLNSDFLTTGVVKVTLMQLNQSNFDVEQWLNKSMGLRYFRGLSKMVTNGNSSNIASLKSTAHSAVTTASPTALAWADFAAAYGALDPAYEANAAWSFNSFTRGYLMGVTDTLGRPLYTINQLASKVSGGFTDAIMGHPVVINQFMDNANTATNIPILYGDHSAYFLRVVDPGLSMYTLREAYLPSGQVGFIGYAMAGGTLIDAGTHPIISVTQHS